MLTWIPGISPIDVTLPASQRLLPKQEEPIVDVDYEVHDDPPTSLIVQAEREALVKANKERTPDEWRERVEAVRKRLKGEDGDE